MPLIPIIMNWLKGWGNAIIPTPPTVGVWLPPYTVSLLPTDINIQVMTMEQTLSLYPTSEIQVSRYEGDEVEVKMLPKNAIKVVSRN